LTATHRVVFTPSGLEARVPDGTVVLDAARLAGADVDSVCGGRGICGRCQVEPSLGEFAKWGMSVGEDALGPWSDNERKFDEKRGLEPGRRLSCGAAVLGDLVVDVPPESQVHKQIVRKELEFRGLRVDPIVDLRYVEVPAPLLGDEVSDGEALAAALRDEWAIEGVHVGHSVLLRLHGALVDGERGVTVAVRNGSEIAAVWPGYVDRIAGAAVDIGSTTLAAYLCDLDSGALLATSGAMNPQIRFGEDLMSRVSYVMMQPDGRRELTATLRRAVDDVLTELLASAGLESDRLLDIFLVGNPIMHHFFLGFDPTPLGTAPFTLATREPVTTMASGVGLSFGNAEVTFGPCIAGHVGADTAGAILAEGPHRSSDVQLLVDVGTNAEIVLGTDQGLFAASSPTGPALEGGEISCGVRATFGAVERVRIDRTTFEPNLSVIGVDGWSNDPGWDESAANVTIAGVCGSGIVEVVGEMFLAGIIDAQGRIDGSLSSRTDRIVADGRTFAYVVHRGPPELRITQNDVRAIQLAKAALRAGIDLLRERSGLLEVDTIRLAGAFGSHIDPLYAMVLGLIPDAPLEHARAAGNASGMGAVRALLSKTQRREMVEVTARVEKIETATEPRFQELFVAAMAFPHETEPTPHLAELVQLPERLVASVPPAGGRRRRRGARKEER
jgi:uncharacterized 2Fe-2S/4Fe-4S cluster protein (DUF4445 family)